MADVTGSALVGRFASWAEELRDAAVRRDGAACAALCAQLPALARLALAAAQQRQDGKQLVAALGVALAAVARANGPQAAEVLPALDQVRRDCEDLLSRTWCFPNGDGEGPGPAVEVPGPNGK
jgi:hypothetical protein